MELICPLPFLERGKKVFCNKCGQEIREGMKFCPKCGAEISKITEKNTVESSRATVKQKKNRKRKGGIVVFISLGLIIAGLIAAFLILKQRKEKMFDSNLATGNKYLEKLDYEKAEDSFLRAIKIDSKAKEPYMKLTELYIANDEIGKAQDIVEQAIKNVSEEEKKEFKEKKKEWENLEDYKWVVNPEIEADDIYYLKGNDFFAHSENEMQKQMTKKYAVIKQGNNYGLIDMEGKWYEGLKCNEVSTILDFYELKLQEPIYSEEYLAPLYDYYMDNSEQLVPAVAVFGDNYGEQGTYYYVDELYNSTDTDLLSMEPRSWELNKLTSAIPIRKTSAQYSSSYQDQNGNFISINQWLDQNGSQYAIWKDDTLVTDFIYEECGSEESGLLAVKKGGKWGYVDETGKEVIKTEYDASWDQYYISGDENRKEYCYAASGGYIPLVKDGVWEMRNKDGNLVIAQGAFEAIRPVYEGKCWVKRNGKWGVIALTNEEVTDEIEEEKHESGLSEEQIYADVINAYGKYFYSDGNEDIGDINLSEKGIANPYHGLYPARTERDSPYIYYALYDINGDGHKECFFTSDVGTEQMDYPGYYDIWTNDGNSAHFLFQGAYRTHQIVCADGCIRDYRSSGAWANQVDFYSFDDQGVTTLVDSYSSEGNAQEMNYRDEISGSSITEEEKENIESKHPRADVQFDWIKIEEG